MRCHQNFIYLFHCLLACLLELYERAKIISITSCPLIKIEKIITTKFFVWPAK